MQEYVIPADMLERYRKATNAVKFAEDIIARQVLAQLKFGKGDLVEHKLSGLYYRIKDVSVSMGQFQRVNVYILGYRYYRSGRKAGREAQSWTHISASEVTKVETDADV